MDLIDLECGICSNFFSDVYCPMILPCSHTFCGYCVGELISTKSKTCPICRKRFTATTAKDLTINRGVLNIAKQLSSMHLETTTTPKSSKTPFGKLKGELQEVVSDFKKKIMKDAIEDCQDIESRISWVLGILDEMIAGVIKTDRDIDKIMKELQEMKPLITEHLTIIRQNIYAWETNLKVVQREKEIILGFEGKLDICESFPSAGVVMGEVEDALQDSRKEINELNRVLQKNERERHDLDKEFLDARVRLKNVLEETAKILDASPQDDVMDNRLQSLSCASRKNVQKKIFINQKFQGKQRVAPAKKGQNNLLFVSHLVEGVVPQNHSIIEIYA